MTKPKYATYEAKPYAILKDGHTMAVEDIAKELNRKSYLEEENAELMQMIQDKDLRIADLEVVKFQRYHDKECWIYQGDNEDYPDSLGCPVVMKPEQLQAMLVKIKTFESIINESQGVAGYHQNGDIAEWGEFGL